MPVVSLKRISGRHVADLRDRAGEVHDRVRLQRDRAVAGDAVRHQLDAARNLLERLDGRVLGDAADADRAAAFGEAVLGVDLRIVLRRP